LSGRPVASNSSHDSLRKNSSSLTLRLAKA
jgi:hypothetical protein